jgi:diguanylate cyclase (GGDEF)-like protein
MATDLAGGLPIWRIPIPIVDNDRLVVREGAASDTFTETILIAEDDPIFRRLLQNRLHNWGYRVISVRDGAEAWTVLSQSNTPDLLILDWMMPGIDGLELCRRIRERQHDSYQYILLVTGKDGKHDIVKGLEAGADDYLTKPFDLGELRARVRTGERILSLQRELIQAREILRFQATHDHLTGLWSRGATMDLLSNELQRALRSHTPTGILMVDLDHFKHINDTHGHLTGDKVLKETAQRINRAVRAYDFVGRYGGEEFLAVLSNCASDELGAVAERVRLAVAETPIVTTSASVHVTVSIGGIVTLGGTCDLELIATADRSLYEAKRSGRNRIEIGCLEAT